jgi:hypothetical protein
MERRLTESLVTCSTFSKLPLVSSILPLTVTSTEELSPIKIGEPLHASKEEYTTFEASMLCDAPESVIQALGEELMAINEWLEIIFLEFGSFGFFFLASSGMQSPRLFF